MDQPRSLISPLVLVATLASKRRKPQRGWNCSAKAASIAGREPRLALLVVQDLQPSRNSMRPKLSVAFSCMHGTVWLYTLRHTDTLSLATGLPLASVTCTAMDPTGMASCTR